MKRYNGGTKVDGGYYLNLSNWGFEAVNGDHGVLPGTDTYLHLPGVVVLPAALVLSFVFVVFVPFIGFAMVAYALARKVGLVSRSGAEKLAGTMAPSWTPGVAYFARDAKEGEKKEGEAAPTSPELTELEKDIAARREAEQGEKKES